MEGLGQNAERLADLVNSDKVFTLAISDKYKKLDGGYKETPKGIALTMVNPVRVTVHSNPALHDKDVIGLIKGSIGTIPVANVGEAVAHELLSHSWSRIIRGNAMGSMQNLIDTLDAENAVRATDPSRGLKSTHQGQSVIKKEHIEKYIK